jgi:hypothetical protein
VYFASTVSIDSSEAGIILGQDKNTLLLKFKIGLEQSLAHGDFLDRPNVTGLIALAIYLACSRRTLPRWPGRRGLRPARC